MSRGRRCSSHSRHCPILGLERANAVDSSSEMTPTSHPVGDLIPILDGVLPGSVFGQINAELLCEEEEEEEASE